MKSYFTTWACGLKQGVNCSATFLWQNIFVIFFLQFLLFAEEWKLKYSADAIRGPTSQITHHVVL